ncbi:MAG: hypothetical protein RLZZ432_242 [Chloroflexota bacterium]
MSGERVCILADAPALAEAAAELVVASACAAVEARGRFDLCTTGGSTPAALYAALRMPERSSRMPWQATHVWFGDDRLVPRHDTRSNLAPVDAVLLAPGPDGSPSPMPADAVHPWPTGADSGDRAVAGYLAELSGSGLIGAAGSQPVFDLVLLGVGGDGHCLSVFPGSPLAQADAPVAAAVPAPTHIEPHVARLSFSLGVLRSARSVCVLAPGAAKAEILARVLDGGVDLAGGIGELPARAARIATATWLLDRESAARITAR